MIFRKFAGVKELKHVADIDHVCSERKPCRNSSIAFRTFPVWSKWRPNIEAGVNGSGVPCALRPLV